MDKRQAIHPYMRRDKHRRTHFSSPVTRHPSPLTPHPQLASQVEPVEAAYRHQRANTGSSSLGSSRGKSGGGVVEPYPGFESVSSSRRTSASIYTRHRIFYLKYYSNVVRPLSCSPSHSPFCSTFTGHRYHRGHGGDPAGNKGVELLIRQLVTILSQYWIR